jgi:intergrase/recombinase
MSDTEQREIADLFVPSRTCEEIREAIKLEEERRAALIKKLYRLRGLRL